MMEVQGMSPCGCGASPGAADSALTTQPFGASASGGEATRRADLIVTIGSRICPSIGPSPEGGATGATSILSHPPRPHTTTPTPPHPDTGPAPETARGRTK